MSIRAQPVLVAALVLSLGANVWLAVHARATTPSRSEPTAAAVDAPSGVVVDEAAAPDASTSLQSIARVIEEAKRARAAERARVGETEASRAQAQEKRSLVDARVVLDAQCRHARSKAEEVFRRDAPGIRRFLLEDDTRGAEELARDLEQKKSELADVVGTEPSDARVQELATKRFEMERAARVDLKAAVQGEPPDCAAMDVVLDLYRRQDAEARRILGDEKAEDVMLADVDGRAGVLAIGSSLVGESWEAGAAAMTSR